MIGKKLSLIDEQTSPLHRIMWLYNPDEPARRTFENNICAFHIGKGFFLSVAHNLRIQQGYYKSIDDRIYLQEILPKLDGAQKGFLDQCYFTDDYTRKKYLNKLEVANLEHIAKILKQKRFDTRYVTLAQKKICNPYVIFQFKENLFYNDINLTRTFDNTRQFFDKEAHRYMFISEVELVYADYNADIALYRLVNTPVEVINAIPELGISYHLVDEDKIKLYCLQSSPSSVAGRLLNNAKIEGLIDHFNVFPDDIGGNYVTEGYRYLINGYFRFGSSGAPYIHYDEEKQRFVAVAVQSEASGIQLSIKNDKEGNFQYVNAIASPLYNVKNELEKHINGQSLLL